MKFNLKAKIVLNAEFNVEEENLVDARKIAEKRMGNLDFDSIELGEVWWDMTDPTIREYNRQWCQKQVEAYLKKHPQP